MAVQPDDHLNRRHDRDGDEELHQERRVRQLSVVVGEERPQRGGRLRRGRDGELELTPVCEEEHGG